MDPATAMLLGSLFSGGFGFLSNLLGGGDIDLESFSGTAGLTPVNTLARAVDATNEYARLAGEYAGRPVRLGSSFAQQPPVFTGGGLPMPIGVTGVDPAMADPSLLEGLGLDVDPQFWGESGAGRERRNPPPGGGDGDGRIPATTAGATRRGRASDAEEALMALRFIL